MRQFQDRPAATAPGDPWNSADATAGPVTAIANPTGKAEAAGYVASGVAEEHSLNLARYEDTNAPRCHVYGVPL